MGENTSQKVWYLSRGGKQHGPISRDELLRVVGLGKLRPDDLLWKPGFGGWKAAISIPGLLTPLEPDTPSTSMGQSSDRDDSLLLEQPQHGINSKPKDDKVGESSPKPRGGGEQRASNWGWLVWIGVICSVVGVILALLPVGNTLSMWERYRVETVIKKALKDPESAMFSGYQIRRAGTLVDVCGYVNARNSLGGYVGDRPFYGIIMPISGFSLFGMDDDYTAKQCRELFAIDTLGPQPPEPSD